MSITISIDKFEAIKSSVSNLSDYTLKEIDEQKVLCSEINKIFPCELFFTIEEHEQQNYYQYNKIYLKHPGIDISISYNKRTKKYSIDLVLKFKDYRNISNNDITNIYQVLISEKPKEIGVLTSKKVQEWVNYYLKANQLISEENSKNKEIIDNFRKSLETLNLPIQFTNNKKSGYYVKGGLRYSFNIFNNGFIEEKITVEASNKLENFLKMSDNKLE